MLLTIITGIFLVVYALLIFMYYRQWKALPDFEPAAPTPSVFISVVIAARNEEATLPVLLADLAKQNYPADLYEIIIVNDFSTDRTADAGKPFLNDRVSIILPSASPEKSSKKRAIETGVLQAKGELILITDADCRVGPQWIKTTAMFYQEKGADFIAAPVKFVHDRSWLTVFQSLDFITLQGITAASVHSGAHTMCNGANLAYTKKAFMAVNGFEGIDKIVTGDDMLLMHKIWKKDPAKVFYLKNRDAIVSTQPMPTRKEFFMQRKRWASKTLVYDDWRIIVVLVFILLFNSLFFVLLAASFFNAGYWIHFLLYIVLKTMIEWPFVSSVAGFYNEKKLMRYFFVMQPAHIFYTVSVGLISQFGKYEWKGRRTR